MHSMIYYSIILDVRSLSIPTDTLLAGATINMT